MQNLNFGLDIPAGFNNTTSSTTANPNQGRPFFLPSRGGRGRGRGRGNQEAEYVPRRTHVGQRPVDLYSSIITYLDRKKHSATNNPFTFHVPPHEYYAKDVLPAFATPHNASTALCTQWAHTSQYPDNIRTGARAFFTAMKWANTGRKLLCSTNSGEFILWNGASFTAEMKTLAHKSKTAIRALAWGPKSGVVISGDEAGTLCLWTQTFSQAAEIHCNQQAIRDVCFAPSELRFCTGGGDGTCAVWDIERFGGGSGARRKRAAFRRTGPNKPDNDANENDNNNNLEDDGFDDDDDDDQDDFNDKQNNNNTNKNINHEPEVKLTGQGGDVLSVRWHPHQSLVATGSQDKHIRLFDPRTSAPSIADMQGHGDSVSQVRWHELGRETSLLSGSHDGTARLWDIRNTRQEVTVYNSHTRRVNGLEWHPTHPDVFATGGQDGLVAFWIVTPNEGSLRSNGITFEVSKFAAGIEAAHERWRNEANPVFSLAWSPMGGHVLATGSAELHIWTRNKPGSIEEMRFEAENSENNAQQQNQEMLDVGRNNNNTNTANGGNNNNDLNGVW